MSGYGGDGGGFSNDTPSRGGSSDGKPRRNYDEQTLIPVTIRMVQSAIGDPAGGGEMTLPDGRALHMVKIVAAVRNAEERSTNIFIDIEDGTGMTQVKVWVNEGEDCSAVTKLRQDGIKEHHYVRVIGQVREFDGQRQIVANDVRAVSSGNEMTYHMLEVAYSHKKAGSRGANPMGGGMGMGIGIGNMASNAPPQGGGMGVGKSYGGGMGGGNALNDAVLQCIKAMGSQSDSGVHVSSIIQQVAPQGYSEQDIRIAIGNLSNEGHIYSTIDEDNYQYAE